MLQKAQPRKKIPPKQPQKNQNNPQQPTQAILTLSCQSNENELET